MSVFGNLLEACERAEASGLVSGAYTLAVDRHTAKEIVVMTRWPGETRPLRFCGFDVVVDPNVDGFAFVAKAELEMLH